MRAWVWLLFLSLWQLLARPLRAQDCCSQPACQAQARTYAYQLAALTKPLGACSVNKAEAEAALARYQTQNPMAYASLQALIRELKEWSLADASRNLCFLQLLNELSGSQVGVMDAVDWNLLLAEALPAPSSPSPEFCQQFAATIELNQGVLDAFRASESYLLSTQAFVLLKTLGTGRGQCGGRARLWLGGGLNYQDHRAVGVVSGKMEYRLRDVEAANLATLGHVKAIVEPSYGFGINTLQLLAGLGADVHLLQVQVLGGYQSRGNRYAVHFGLVYPLVGH